MTTLQLSYCAVAQLKLHRPIWERCFRQSHSVGNSISFDRLLVVLLYECISGLKYHKSASHMFGVHRVQVRTCHLNYSHSSLLTRQCSRSAKTLF